MPRFADDFDAVFDHLDPPDKKGRRSNYVLLLDLREALPQYSRSVFDAELRKLRKERRYSLDVSDGRHVRLTRAQLDAGIVEGGDPTPLVYAQKIRPVVDNPRGGPKGSTLNAFYDDGWRDSSGFDPSDFDTDVLTRKVRVGEDLLSVVRAAVDVFLKEAEEAGMKDEWLEQNADLLAEVQEDEGPFEPELLYNEWRRGWRDGVVTHLPAFMLGAVDED